MFDKSDLQQKFEVVHMPQFSSDIDPGSVEDDLGDREDSDHGVERDYRSGPG